MVQTRLSAGPGLPNNVSIILWSAHELLNQSCEVQDTADLVEHWKETSIPLSISAYGSIVYSSMASLY